MKKIIFGVILILIFVVAVKANRNKIYGDNSSINQSASTSQFTSGETKYVTDLTKNLDVIISKSKQTRSSSHSLTFASNIFLAHGAFIPYFSTNELIKFADALKEAGAKRIEIYPDPQIWIKNKQDSIKKYDALIKHIRDIGLEFTISPEFGPANKFKNFQDFKSQVVPVLGQIAERYKPNIFGVVHEPTTMQTRMKFKGSVSDWEKFVQEAATMVKARSPNSRVDAGAEWYEKAYFDKWTDEPNVDMLSLNIYDVKKLSTYSQMAQLAKKNGKKVYIAETWRSPYQDPSRKASSLEEGISKDIGNIKYKELDQKWMEALTAWANALELEGITPVWSATFFKYETSGETSAISYRYNKDSANAVMKGQRTDTFGKFQALVKEYGR